MPRPRLERPIALVLLAAVIAIYLSAGFRGLDYGPHEDEWYVRDATRTSVEELTFFPRGYVYNHLYFVPSILVVAVHERARVPEAVAQIFEDPQAPFDVERYPALFELQEDARRYVDTDAFILDTRAVFYSFSALALLAVFLTVLAIQPRSYLLAVAGAAALGFSFQVVSHARFIAVDAMLTTLIAIQMAILARLLRPGTRLRSLLLLQLAAVVAGLAVGCKMTGVVALVPLFVAPFARPLTWPSRRERFGLMLGTTALALATFFLTTPGALLQPFHFLFAQAELQRGYASSNHPHSVGGPLEHLALVAEFLGASLGSTNRVLAIAMSLIALYGMRVWLRTQRALALLGVALAASLLGLLVPRALFFARNYLPLAPWLAVAFALGLGGLGRQLFALEARLERSGVPRTSAPVARLPAALGALVVLAFALEVMDLFAASESIRTTTREQILADARAHLMESGAPFRISPPLREALGPELDERFVCRRGALDEEPERVAMFYGDHDPGHWLSNQTGFVERTFASREADYDWYATWVGRQAANRVVVLSTESAMEMGVPLARFLACRERRGVADDTCEPPPSGMITMEELLISMRDLDAHLKMDERVESVRLASSFDRHSLDGDWFANRDRAQYVRVEGEERVMMDVRGPGVITRFGSANPSGNLRVYVDGEIVLEGPMREILAARDLPVGDDLSFVAARGHNLYLPIPYQESCKVTVDTTDGLYYQLTYRTYVPGTRIESFSPAAVERAMCNTEGRRREAPAEALPVAADGHASASEPSVLARTLDTALGEPATVLAPDGGARITELRIDAAGLSAEALRGTELALSFDGETTVRTPLGDFFHGGPGLRPFESQWVSVKEDGALIARWPMPFARTASIALRARNAPAAQIGVSLRVEPAPFTEETLRFYAHWRPPTPVRVSGEGGSPIASDLRVAEVHGRGLYVGLIMDVANPSGSWWGEGDEKIFVDGEDFPSHFGTGTEDYFGWAWCSTVQFAKDYVGQIRSNTAHNGGYLSAYRWLALDAIPFHESLVFDMEVLHWITREPNLDADFDTIALFYLAPGATLDGPELRDEDFRIPDMPEEYAAPAPPGQPPYGCGQGQGP